jgi:protein O-mannosyl-transferase
VKPRRWIPVFAVQLLLFCLGAFLLYFPNLYRTFASDDFLVMKRVGMDKQIRINGFFRPLSDITLYFNYLIGGFDPTGYYALNILLHGVSAGLFFQFCLRWKWTVDQGQQRRFALLAALLFLAYPFHSEGIAWILGRGSVLAALFGIAALLETVSGQSTARRIGCCCIWYFIGMAAYESVILLPLMVMVILYGRGVPGREIRRWAVALGMTLGIHILLRIVMSGRVAGEYGYHFVGLRALTYAGNLFRVTDRLFLPPMQDIVKIAILYLLLVAGLTGALFFFWRKSAAEAAVRKYFIQLMLLLIVACVAPLLSGVSSHTSESDRLLYFPSCFLCAGVALLLVYLIRGKRLLFGVVSALLLYEVFFVEAGNRNWIEASAITRQVLAVVSGALDRASETGRAWQTDRARQTDRVAGRKIFVVNLPDERDGAYIFRHGLAEALLIRGIDTSGLVVVSHLRRDEVFSLKDSLPMAGLGDIILYWDGSRLRERGR